jgi:hypothetical protein
LFDGSNGRLFDLLSHHFCEIDPSMWANLRARLVLSDKTRKQLPPSVKKWKLRLTSGTESTRMYGIPDGIIAHLTRECGGNLHDANVVEVTCGSFEKEIYWANPHSGAWNNDPDNALSRHVRFLISPNTRCL